MKNINEYIARYVDIYTFEDYCEDNRIMYDDIDDKTHEEFVTMNWSIVRHRPYYIYKSHIYESILNSYDSKKLYDEIEKNFNDYIVHGYFPYKDKSTVKSIILKYKKDPSFVKTDKFEKLLNLYNYFITYIDEKYREIHLEPNVPDDVTNYIYDKCGGILYHVTKKSAYQNIKKYGLKPRTASYRKYPERVYFTTGEDRRSIIENIDFVISILKQDESYINNISVLKVDLSLYKNRISIYRDNTMDNDSYWTSEYIPPYCIEEI